MTDQNEPIITAKSLVSLKEITKDTVRIICNLKVFESQNRFVAPNAVSIAQAYFCETAWFRAIYADDTPVGFLMLDKDMKKPEYYLWRFMIDEKYQKIGLGYKAMELIIDYVKTLPNSTEFILSCIPGEGSPEEFYRKLGFERTGEMDDGEVVMRLRL